MAPLIVRDPVLEEMKSRDRELFALLQQQDSMPRVIQALHTRFPPLEIATATEQQRLWELAGLTYRNLGRMHDALATFFALYEHMLLSQDGRQWCHKGMPLCWISDCFGALGFPAHAKRYLMLTLCEDAFREAGKITPSAGGVYFRLVWQYGLSDGEFHRYAAEMWEKRAESADAQLFPEAVLQRVDTAWLTELPASQEFFT